MAVPIQTCYRHSDRRAGVTCQRCDRPICPQCMSQASVGFHCPECARQGKQRVYTANALLAGRRPVVTQLLIAINVAVFLIGLGQGSTNAFSGGSTFSDDYGVLGSARLVFLDGSSKLIGVAHGEWWRLITGGFLHASLLHIGFNMFALWVLGSQLETAVGKLRFAVVYFVALLTGSLGVMILSPHSPTVGASGAIFGLFGLALAGQRFQGINIWQSGLGGILLINLAFTFGVRGISIGGHLGGLAGGYVCGVLLYEVGSRLPNKNVPVALCALLGAASLAAAIVVASGSA